MQDNNCPKEVRILERLGFDELDERYEILKLSDTGGTSRVFLVSDRRLNCQWAIKKAGKRNRSLNTVITEVNILKSLNHPALPRIVDIREDDDYYYIVMDYVQGENLRTILRADGPQNEENVVAWGIALCDVMTYLHSNGVIYRDMKPSNVMLTPDGQIKLIDFGIARHFRPGALEDTTALGTEGYAAPEQYEGCGQTDERTDVFGIGVTLFQLLTDINPATFSGNSLSIRVSNPGLSTGLEKIILRCTNRDRDKRYQNTEELKQALLNYRKLDDEYLKRKSGRRSRMIICFSLSCICFIASALAFYKDNLNTGRLYESLVSDVNNGSNIEEAIGLKPERSEGYKALVDSYGDVIDQDELASFYHVYAENLQYMKNPSEVSMYAGERILTSYEEDSLRAGLLASEQCFRSVDESCDKYPAAKAYIGMAEFYREYVLSKSGVLIKEASQKEYRVLLSDMTEIIKSVYEYDGAERKNLLLVSCELSLNLIKEQVHSMREAGIKKTKVKKVCDLAGRKISEIKSGSETIMTKKRHTSLLLKQVLDLLEDEYSERNMNA